MHFNIYNYDLTVKDAVSNYIYFIKNVLEKKHHNVTLISDYNHSSVRAVSGEKNALIEGLKTLFARKINWFHYSGYYPLIRLIRYVKGFKIFDYHSVTPPELWPYNVGKDLVVKGVAFRKYVQYADLVIVHSKSAYDELRSYMRENQKHIMLRKYQISNYEKNVNKAAYKNIGVDSSDKILLFVGRVSPNKRVQMAIKALKYLPKNAKLIIIGKYDNEPYITEYDKCIDLAESENVLDRVLFLGQVSDEVLNDFYNIADVFVMPSLHEGFCIPVVEAMKCGTPVVAANAAALPETVGNAGLLFNPDDEKDLAGKIKQVLNNKTLKSKLIKEGFAQYKKRQLKESDIMKILRMIK